jgi:methylphosphotriester-DNA--protein-cysteine methyltransferase
MAPSTPDSTESPTTGMEQPPEVDRAAEVLERTSGNFIGNKKTRVFHAADAGNLPGEDNRVYFETEEEAVAAGFRPAEREGLETAES